MEFSFCVMKKTMKFSVLDLCPKDVTTNTIESKFTLDASKGLNVFNALKLTESFESNGLCVCKHLWPSSQDRDKHTGEVSSTAMHMLKDKMRDIVTVLIASYNVQEDSFDLENVESIYHALHHKPPSISSAFAQSSCSAHQFASLESTSAFVEALKEDIERMPRIGDDTTTTTTLTLQS